MTDAAGNPNNSNQINGWSTVVSVYTEFRNTQINSALTEAAKAAAEIKDYQFDQLPNGVFTGDAIRSAIDLQQNLDSFDKAVSAVDAFDNLGSDGFDQADGSAFAKSVIDVGRIPKLIAVQADFLGGYIPGLSTLADVMNGISNSIEPILRAAEDVLTRTGVDDINPNGDEDGGGTTGGGGTDGGGGGTTGGGGGIMSALSSFFGAISGMFTPLIIDLDSDGVEVTNYINSSVKFDLSENGFAQRTAWVNGDDGFLAIDYNKDGIINSNAELFGSVSEDGFTQLSYIDSNNDGLINSEDEMFSDLLIWKDGNADGITDNGEISNIGNYGISSISLEYQLIDEYNNGNHVSHRSVVEWTDGTLSSVEDVWFQASKFDTQFIAYDESKFNNENFLLPTIKGSGELKDLHFAYNEDGDLVEFAKSLVNTANKGDISKFIVDFRDFAFSWADVSDVDINSRGPNVNAKHLEFIEAFFGTEFNQGSLFGTSPGPQAGAQLELLYVDVVNFLAAKFLRQVEFTVRNHPDFQLTSINVEIFSNIEFDFKSDTFDESISDHIAEIANYMNGDEISAIDAALLISLVRNEATINGADFEKIIDEVYTEDSEIEFVESTLSQVWVSGTSEDDIISGSSKNEILDAGEGNDILLGGFGSDTYIWSEGRGNNVIDEYGYGSADSDTIALDGLTATDVTLARTDDDLEIVATASGETLTVQDHFRGTRYGIETIVFADGEQFDRSAIVSAAWFRGDDSDETLIGSGASETFDSGGGDDVIEGGYGSDTYIWGVGHGNDLIDELGYGAADTDVISFEGLNAEDVTLVRIGDDLAITADSSDETLVVQDHFSGTRYGIETIIFADGNEIDRDAIVADAMVQGTDGDDILIGTSASETFNGGGGDDLIKGGYGSDTYVWGTGHGNNIVDEYGYATGDSDTLVLDELVAGDLIFARTGNDLSIAVSASDEVITIQDHFRGARFGIETIAFANGETLDQDAIEAASWYRGNDGDETLIGSNASETFDGGGGDDLLKGGYGSDTYVWGTGRGNDTIDEYGYANGENDRLVLDGLNESDVTLARTGNDLSIIADSSQETITVQDHFRATRYGIETIVFADGQELDRDATLLVEEAPEETPEAAFEEALHLEKGIIADGAFGNKFDGQMDDDGIIVFSFDGGAGDLALSLNGYDIDYANEVEVLLNGESFGFLEKGLNNGLSAHAFEISLDQQIDGSNELGFRQNTNLTWKWGVTDVLIDDIIM